MDGVAASQTFRVGQTWQHVILEFQPLVPIPVGSLYFNLGAETGSYWISHLQVREGTAGIVTRQFTNGIAVLNDSALPQTAVALAGGTLPPHPRCAGPDGERRQPRGLDPAVDRAEGRRHPAARAALLRRRPRSGSRTRR